MLRKLFGNRPTQAGVRLPIYQVSRFHPDRIAEVMRAIQRTIELHGAEELTGTERAIWNAAEVIEVFTASPKNDWGAGHKVEHWPSAIVGLERMGLKEVAEIAHETVRIKYQQAQLAPDDEPGQDQIVELMAVQTRRFAEIEKTTDFVKLHRQFIDRAYQWA